MRGEKSRTRRSVLKGAVLLGAALVTAAPPVALANEGPKIVVLGDSLSAGYGLAPGQSFPDKLQKALTAKGVAAQIIGAGVSGDTLSGGLSRLDWSVGDDADGVIVQLGANDALRGLPVERAVDTLDKIVTRLKERGKGVMLAGMMAPPNMGATYGEAFNGMYKQAADKHGVALYPFFLDGVAAQASLNQDDGIHPTAEGIDVIVERILPDVEAFIASLN